ncbi:MAG: hypothetical protein OXI63_18195, partial [Candidatus Poribacteria bacterium]|nr:hypothetical protein [Candidatus Poribacteria bacterium]
MKNIIILFTLMLLLLGLPCRSSAYLCGTPHLSDTKMPFRPLPTTDGDPGANTIPLDLPGNLTAPALPAAPALPIGTQRTFFVPDFRSMQQYTVSAVLQGIGNFCYIFVEEAEWNTRVTVATVASIVHAFEVATPANPEQGIYPTLTRFFGLPPDIDENGRVILLL